MCIVPFVAQMISTYDLFWYDFFWKVILFCNLQPWIARIIITKAWLSLDKASIFPLSASNSVV